MFHSISEQVLVRMQYLERIDSKDRQDGTPRLQRLRQITPDTGKFLALLAAGAPQGDVIEIGTSAGYSTLWLAMACKMTDRSVTTLEVLPEKAKLARETFNLTRMESSIRLVEGDALHYLSHYQNIAFCFLDAEKEVYGECYEAVIPNLVKGGLLVADNAIDFRETLQPMLDRALTDERVDALIVPIGNGELVCRKV